MERLKALLAWCLIAFLISLALVPSSTAQNSPTLGARYSTNKSEVEFAVYSSKATRVEVCLFDSPFGQNERVSFPLTKNSGDIWVGNYKIANLSAHRLQNQIYYGYRAWGPNWPYDAMWTKGSSVGFIADVDQQGNRFNPNKLLLDPYAVEVSHDFLNQKHTDATKFASGPRFRHIDSGPYAPKGIILDLQKANTTGRPTHPLRDDIIYEVNLRGLTKGDINIPEDQRGTYLAAAKRAKYLKGLGVTAVEFLPIQEVSNNDKNDLIDGTDISDSAKQDQYWGYMTLNYFSPDRRYSFDKSPGGPTREFQRMVEAFHQEGIKVYLDVVYNHTAESGLWSGGYNEALIVSWRGLDNGTYYELGADARYYSSDNGVGPNFNCANPVTRNLIMDSLLHWKDNLGVDGFRFDLAPFLGNAKQRDGFRFDKMDPNNVLNRAVRDLPVRPDIGGQGVDLIAEPWGGSYEIGNFPWGWAEWNGKFRDAIRMDLNKLGVLDVTPGELASRICGSQDLFKDDGRKPWHSVNFITVHDGLTLWDLVRFNRPNNKQDWPNGPSDGDDDDENSWDQSNVAADQRKASRNSMVLLMLSIGVPLINGGDEFLRSLNGNSNPWNVDSSSNWLNWQQADTAYPKQFVKFVRNVIAFRKAHKSLNPLNFLTGSDHNSNHLKDVTWLGASGSEITPGSPYWDDETQHLVMYRIDSTEFGDPDNSVLVAFNGWRDPVSINIPKKTIGHKWYRVCDTATWAEPAGNIGSPGDEISDTTPYKMEGRSVLILVEKRNAAATIKTGS